VDDETFDCARANAIFHVCEGVLNVRHVCKRFCGLCGIGNWYSNFNFNNNNNTTTTKNDDDSADNNNINNNDDDDDNDNNNDDDDLQWIASEASGRKLRKFSV